MCDGLALSPSLLCDVPLLCTLFQIKFSLQDISYKPHPKEKHKCIDEIGVTVRKSAIISLSDEKPTALFSIYPGIIFLNIFQCSVNVTTLSKAFTIKVHWIAGIFTKYEHNASLHGQTCFTDDEECLLAARFLKLDRCINFKSLSRGNENFHVFIELKKSRTKLLSWNEASKLCNSTGSHLPVFLSREELMEFTALLQLSPMVTFTEALFLGLDQVSSSTTNPSDSLGANFSLPHLRKCFKKLGGSLFGNKKDFCFYNSHPFSNY